MRGASTLAVILALGWPASQAAAAPTVDEFRDLVAGARRNGDPATALTHLARLEQAHKSAYQGREYDYLRADLAEAVGDDALAQKSLRRLIAARSALADRASLRLARLLGEAQPAAALPLVRDFAKRFPASAVAREARILEVVLNARAGRPRTADGLRQRLPKPYRRDADQQLLAVWAATDAARARPRALQILNQSTTDAAAYAAAEYLVETGTDTLGDADRSVLARTLYGHRAFRAAMLEFARLAEGARVPDDRADARFLLGRAAMKAGDEEAAFTAFEALVAAGGALGERSLYQLGRLAQQCGDEAQAIEHFRQLAWTGSAARGFADEGALKLIRLHAGAGRIAEAAEFLRLLDGRAGISSQSAAKGGVVVAGALCRLHRPTEALAVLAGRRPRDPELRRELAYWRGVALHGTGRQDEAAAAFEVLGEGTDLLAGLARERWSRLSVTPEPTLLALVDEAERLLAAGDLAAAKVLAEQAIAGGVAGSHGARAESVQCRADRRLPAPLASASVAAGRGSRRDRQVAWILLDLGLDVEAAVEFERVPGKDAQELYDLARLAFDSGQARATVRFGEVLRNRLALRQRDPCLPDAVFDLLYPRPYDDLIERSARAARVDPDLVRSIMREESRFDPTAHSPAGARGLMQFIPETADWIGRSIGLRVAAPEMVFEPHVAIPLGATYLGQLVRLFDGCEAAAVAAYNAGEEAAFEWLQRTDRGDLDEFLREVEYSETRTYVDRVLSTLAAYRSRRPPRDLLR